jgi:glycosyltransferase involved in cell wall biosynthesis
MTNLAVIPSDPISAYEAKGTHVWCERYYNPAGHFDKVYLFSPLEKEEKFQYGMQTIPTSPKELPQRLEKYQADILRAYGGYWPCDMACRNRHPRVPVVVSVHDTNPEELYNGIKFADVVFCMSKSVRDLVLTKFKHPDRAWILPNRYDENIFKPQGDFSLPKIDAMCPWEKRLLCIGRLSEQKNQDTLIRALPLLGESYGCLFIGRNDKETLEELARSLGVADQCRFVPSVANDILPQYYCWADAMVTPSRWEGFGIVFIEALACGAVVVTSDVGPMNEYITDGENGLLVADYESPEALAKKIRIACESTELREKMQQQGPKSVLRFERQQIDALEVEYYNCVLSMREELLNDRKIISRIKYFFTKHS